MTHIDLKNLSELQREAWVMRYRYGWRVTRIALHLGTSHQAVSRVLGRAQRRAGLGRPMRVRVIRTQPRLATVQSLSDIFDY